MDSGLENFRLFVTY